MMIQESEKQNIVSYESYNCSNMTAEKTSSIIRDRMVKGVSQTDVKCEVLYHNEKDNKNEGNKQYSNR